MCPVGRYFCYKTRKGQIPKTQLPMDVAPGHKLGSLHNHYADHSEHPRSQDQALNVITPMGKEGRWLFCECADDFCRDVQEEDGRNERQREHEDDEWVSRVKTKMKDSIAGKY